MSINLHRHMQEAVRRLGRIALVAAIASAILSGRAAAQTQLSCGQVVNGSIAAAGQVDRITFPGDAGDVVSLTMVDTSAIDPAFTPVVTLTGPGTNTTRTAGLNFHTLPASGTYTVSIRDLSNTLRGSYAFRLGWIFPLAKQCGDRTALACGQEVQGSIASELELDLLTFTGPQGASFNVSLQQLNAIDLPFQVHGELVGPNGARLGFVPVRGSTSVTLPATGTYGVAVFDLSNFRRRGTYSVGLTSAAPCPSNQPPGPPSNLSASIVGSTVTLNWAPPAPGGEVTSYVLEAGLAPGAANATVFDTGSPATSFTAGTVPAGTYYVRVKARNGFGTSAASNEVVVAIGGGPGPCGAAPSSPSGLTAVVSGQTVTLTWNAAAGIVSTYVIQVGSTSGASNLVSLATGSATGLTAAAPPGTYFVRVLAQNACGVSGPSNEVVVTVR